MGSAEQQILANRDCQCDGEINMLNIPDGVKSLFKADGIRKNFHVHFPNGETSDLNNENVIQESVKFTESLCSRQYFKFGLAEASQIEFVAVGIPNVLGAVIQCAIEIDCSSLGSSWANEHPVDASLPFLEPQTCMVGTKMYYRIPYGEFVVDTCPRDHGAMFQRQITAYSDNSGTFGSRQSIPGQLPYQHIKLSAIHWVIAQTLKKSDMTLISDQNWSDSTGISTEVEGMCSEYGQSIVDYFYGVHISRSSTRYLHRGDIYALTVDYKEHDFDSYGKALMTEAMNSFNAVYSGFLYRKVRRIAGWDPSGTTYETVYMQQFNRQIPAEAYNLCFGLYPCYWLEIPYIREGYNEPYELMYITKPVFLKPNEQFIIDLTDINKLIPVDQIQTPGGYVMDPTLVGLTIRMPVVWAKDAYWRFSDLSRCQVLGWNNAAPFGNRDVVIRSKISNDSGWKAYLKTITTDDYPLSVNLEVANTFEIDKGDPLFYYYTYSNAVSVSDLLEGTMEILGAFWKKTRTGEAVIFNISENQTETAISSSEWEEFWWDENEVEPIGNVNVKSKDSNGNSIVTTYKIGTGGSVYSMEDNAVMNNTDSPPSTVQNVLNTYFRPNASVVNFTPVDLTMKGLPYLEAGDKIELTADDGSVVDSFILEQTITGIQQLKTVVTSVNGEILEVNEA